MKISINLNPAKIQTEKLTDFERKYRWDVWSHFRGPTSSKLFVLLEKTFLVYYINAQAKVAVNLLLIYAALIKVNLIDGKIG